ncbi:MAG: hypothetical protein E6Q67_03290 [Roseateles sp.]|nr:MAG: hypothetical protein E6Q67_03290 [Roseateles sp.]
MNPETFLKEVGQHQMTVLLDDELYRHLRFQAVDSEGRRQSPCWFDVITSPGLLVYTGDMGAYCFRRLDDMLVFFRRGAEHGTASIDMRYWAEKCVSQDKSGIERFDVALFRRRLDEEAQQLLDGLADQELVEARDALAELREEVETADDQSEIGLYRLVLDFEMDGRHPFSDFYEVNAKSFTHHFTWCCYALAWAVSQYDNHRAGLNRTPAHHGEPNSPADDLVETMTDGSAHLQERP